jgi:hypothetical protein
LSSTNNCACHAKGIETYSPNKGTLLPATFKSYGTAAGTILIFAHKYTPQTAMAMVHVNVIGDGSDGKQEVEFWELLAHDFELVSVFVPQFRNIALSVPSMTYMV